MAGLYGALLLGLLASPVFMLELMRPPEAGVTIADPPVRIQFPLRQPTGGDHRQAGPVSKGVKNGSKGRPEGPRIEASRPVASVTPLAEPPSLSDPLQQTTPNPEDPSGTDGPPGDSRGGQRGGGRGDPDSHCVNCTGTGEPGFGDRDGPFGPSTPGLVPPRIIPSTRALPQYPAAARRAGLLGTVILMIVVEADGSVGQIEVLRSPDQRWGFDLSAIDAVKQWRYEPALMNGSAVAAYVTVMVEFTLSR